MIKKELRKKYLTLRKQLSRAEVNELSHKIFEKFKVEFPVSAGQKVHVFLTIAKFNEVNTYPFIQYFRENNIRMFIPKVVDNRLISVEFSPETEMEVSDWGIAEPKSNDDAGVKDYDYVITPLLYCDSKGNRIGYGKGYYDGLFHSINPDCKRIGVGFFPPLEEIEDVSASDVPLDYLLTGDKMLSFRGLL